MDNPTTVILAALAVGMILAGVWIYRKRRSDGENPIVAIVFFLKEPRTPAVETVRRIAHETLGVPPGADDPDGAEFVIEMDGPPEIERMGDRGARIVLIQSNHGTFIVNSIPEPYVKRPVKFARSIRDRRLREAVAAHTAWLSVDAFGELDTEEEKAKAYRWIGKLLAGLAGDDCLALYCPELQCCNEYSPSVLEELASNDPLSLFESPTHAPVVDVDGDDPRMKAAVEQAQRRWPEFVEAFRKNDDPERPFLVKVEFAEGDNSEFMWVAVSAIRDDAIEGRLENAPHQLKKVREGDRVVVDLANLNDWAYIKGEETIGGFTMEVIAEMEGM